MMNPLKVYVNDIYHQYLMTVQNLAELEGSLLTRVCKGILLILVVLINSITFLPFSSILHSLFSNELEIPKQLLKDKQW